MTEIIRRDRERSTREAAIIAAAEKTFIDNGFDEASMDAIAKEAEFTKRTLYQYFPSKEDLFLAVVAKGFRLMVDRLAEAGKKGANGLQKLRQAGRALYDFYREGPEAFKLMSQWSHVIRGPLSENPEAETKLGLVNRELFGLIAAFLREGIEDGSLKPAIEVEPTMCRLVFLLTGFLSQLAATGDSFTRQFGLDPEEFCLSTFDLILSSLEPAPK